MAITPSRISGDDFFFPSLEIDHTVASAALSISTANNNASWTVAESQDWLITNNHASANLYFSYSSDPGGTAAQRQICVTPGSSMKIRISTGKTTVYYTSDADGGSGLAQVVY